MYHVFQGYAPYKGDIPERTKGSLVAFESGTTTAYGLNSVLDRGELFLEPGVEVYEGMIVGENARDQDMDVNPCKKKHLTNTRASGSDDAIKLPPCRKSLWKALSNGSTRRTRRSDTKEHPHEKDGSFPPGSL